MKVLGAVLAGGVSRRFGADKAESPLGGTAMLDRVLDVLRPQVADLVVCGRPWREARFLPDRPAAQLGPLGGLCAALHDARLHSLDAVVCAPVDVHPLPADLVELLAGDLPIVIAEQHSVGLWPVWCLAALETYLQNGGRSIYGWIAASGARRANLAVGPLVNINFPADIHDYRAVCWSRDTRDWKRP